ncbi:hypothetical protein MCBG_03406 [Micromonospora sp. M42]|nr:hypothetical protein MCBG_03406 [Micromonospora sp. M42]
MSVGWATCATAIVGNLPEASWTRGGDAVGRADRLRATRRPLWRRRRRPVG